MSTDLFDTYARSFEARRETVMTLGEYLKGCKTDPLMYASPHERLLAAIGEPQLLRRERGHLADWRSASKSCISSARSAAANLLSPSVSRR